MDIYLWQLAMENNSMIEVAFPLTPQEIRARYGAKFLTFDILNTGTVEIPNGNELDEISWEGMLPGEGRSDMSVIKSWKNPADIEQQLRTWKANGTKLMLMITGTSITQLVYIQTFEPTYSGGFGDIQYNITLIQAVELIISSVDVVKAQPQQQSNRPQNTSPKTYTVKQNDNLWTIARKMLGNGARYMEIYNLNKKPKGPLTSPSQIRAGQVLKLP